MAEELKKLFPNDRFMGEEDAQDLREDPALRAMTVSIVQEYSKLPEGDVLSAIDSGVESPRGKGERVWILDPIDGTKGFMTNQNYIVGLALVVDGEAVVAGMANPRLAEQHDVPSIMVAVKDNGLRYWPAIGEGPVPKELAPHLQVTYLQKRYLRLKRDREKETVCVCVCARARLCTYLQKRYLRLNELLTG